MKIAHIGVTGNVGRRIADEALRRGHSVTGIARDTTKIEARPNLTLKSGDTGDPDSLAQLIAEHDVVISSVAFRLAVPHKLIEAVRKSGVKRYVIVGGASSLEVEPGGKRVIDMPAFKERPEWLQNEARGGVEFLDILCSVSDLDWTFLSPAALITDGERTGKFRLGQNSLVKGEDGKSWISYEDYAVALLDEVESPKHIRDRFTVGY